MTRDKIKYIKYKDPQTLNLYEYARDNPVSNTDPNGTDVLLNQNAQGNDFWSNLWKGIQYQWSWQGIQQASQNNLVLMPVGEVGEGVNFSMAAAERLGTPERFVPLQTLLDCIKYGEPAADPQGSRAIMYTIEMFLNNKAYQLEVLYDQETNSICVDSQSI